MPILDPLTQQIIGFCYRVSNILGHGFVEKVYENALAFELRKAKISFAQQKYIEVFYEGVKVGKYLADLVVSLDFGGRPAFPEGRPGHRGGQSGPSLGRFPYRPRTQLPPGYRTGNLPADQLRQGQD